MYIILNKFTREIKQKIYIYLLNYYITYISTSENILNRNCTKEFFIYPDQKKKKFTYKHPVAI